MKWIIVTKIQFTVVSASTCLHYTLSGALPAIMHILLIQKSLKFSQGLCNMKINAHIIPSLSVWFHLFASCLKTIKQFSKIHVNSILALEFQSWYNPEVINKLQMKSNYFKQINFRNMINKHNMCWITKLLH